MIRRRWPIHPQPIPGEFLSDWLQRVAFIYGLSLDDLLKYDLGYSDHALAPTWLNLKPPLRLVEMIAARTGVPSRIIWSMTYANFMPKSFAPYGCADFLTAGETIVEAAKNDPAEAERLRFFLLAGYKQENSIGQALQKIDSLLNELGIVHQTGSICGCP